MNKKEFYQYIGNVLKSSREKSSITQQEMAVLTGLKQSAISRIESGNGNITIETIYLYMSALEMELNFVFYKNKNFKK